MGLLDKWRRTIDAAEAKQKAAEQYDPEKQKKKQYFAQFDDSAFDKFGRPVRHVVITDIAIPFWSMVGLLVQLVLAAIPAVIILALLFGAAKWLWMFLITLAPARH